MIPNKMLLVVVLAISGVASAAAETATSFEEARRLSVATGRPIVMDFWTSWCPPCKAFARDVAEEEALRAALDDVVLIMLDAWESEEGGALALRYHVRGFPTFVVVDADGSEKNRWMGYDTPQNWQGALQEVLSQDRGISELQAQYQENPDLQTAEKLLQYYQRTYAPLQAVALYEDLIRLKPEMTAEYRWNIFEELAGSFGRDHEDIERMRAAHDAVLRLDLEPKQWARMAVLLKPVAWEAGDPDWYASVIPRALQATQGSEDRYVAWAHGLLIEDELIYVQRKPEVALANKRADLDADWKQSVRACMGFGTWCQENRINMDEARQALEAVLGQEDLEEESMLVGLAWSTLGDLRATQGDYAAAVVALDRAIDAMPGVPELYDDRGHYADLAGQRAQGR